MLLGKHWADHESREQYRIPRLHQTLLLRCCGQELCGTQDGLSLALEVVACRCTLQARGGAKRKSRPL